MPENTNHNLNVSDHDILTRLVGSFEDFKQNVNDKFSDIKADIKELKDGVSNRVDILEREKADKKELDEIQEKINNIQKHLNETVETRIDCLETWRTARTEQIENENKKVGDYFKIVLFIGLVILGMCIWHLTGFRI